MAKLTRRGFMAGTGAALSLRVMPGIAVKPGGRRVLTLVYDKALGAMRAIDRVVP